MRDMLLKRVRPLVDRLAEDLVNITVARIELELGRLPEMFDIALSAYACDVEPDLLTRALGPELGALLNQAASPAPASRITVDFMSVPTHPTNKGQGFRVVKPAKVTQSGKARQRAVMKCRKCGALGFRSDGCGRTHNASPATAPASDGDEDEGAVPGELHSSAAVRPKLIEWDEQRRLIALVQQHDDKRALDSLVRTNIGLVHRLARKVPWHAMSYEDVVQEGVIGLMKGIRGFDLASPYRLSTYASHWIWHYIVRSHENGALIRMPARLGMVLVKVSRAQFKLEEKLGRPASEEEIAEVTRIPLGDVRRVMQRGQVTTSLDLTNDDDQSWMHDRLASDGPSPDAELIDSDATTELMTAVDELPTRAAQIIKHRYFDEMTLKETGIAMPRANGQTLSRERVRQIEAVAIETLQKKLSNPREHV